MASLIHLCTICPIPKSQATVARGIPIMPMKPEDLQQSVWMCDRCAEMYDRVKQEMMEKRNG